MKERILGILRSAGDKYTSGEEISRRIGISRTAVWKHIKSLKNDGYVIESFTKKGYRLVSFPDYLYPQEIRSEIDTSFMGRRIYHFDAIASTNEYAKELAGRGAAEGTVVVAEYQRRGKGRMGRKWESPEGGIWLSYILRPKIRPERAPAVTMVCAASVVNVIEKVTGLEAVIKWPNDIFIGDKKVGGILTEMKAEMDRVEYIVQGIGLNANLDGEAVEKLPAGSSSLLVLAGSPVSRKNIAAQFLQEFESLYDTFLSSGTEQVMNIWKQKNRTLNREVTLWQGDEKYSGTAEDITPEGGLVVVDASGEKRVFYSGDVTIGRAEKQG